MHMNVLSNHLEINPKTFIVIIILHVYLQNQTAIKSLTNLKNAKNINPSIKIKEVY